MGIGDEIMLTGEARVLQMRDPRPIKVDYGRGRFRWHSIWENNPRFARPEEMTHFQSMLARPNGYRPYIARKRANKWEWKNYKPKIGEIYLTEEEKAFGARHSNRIIIEPHIKANASPNKQWGWMRWNKLAYLLQEGGLRVSQVGPDDTPILGGAEHIVTTNFRLACAVLAQARAAVLPEGGLHHAAAAVGLRSVVIYGGFISPDQTGYDLHRNLFAGGTPCGMRARCEHCARSMAAIAPEAVAKELCALLEQQRVAA
jgi:ADP-heptose:LPS heptosyltransferase